MSIDEVIEKMGRKALVEHVLGVPTRRYKSVDEWLEDRRENAKGWLPDCLSWQSFCSLFNEEIEDAFEESKVFYDIFPDWTLEQMAEDLEKALSIRGK